MKARTIFTIITLIPACFLHAQLSPMFETTIYVEDALGNLDSVVIGHDLDANNEYNPQFGEIDISDPFDSIFEVRAGHGLAYQGPDHDIVLSKRIIGGIEQQGYIEEYDCYAGREHIILFIQAIHNPVAVYWDSLAFDTSWCTRGSIISSHGAHLALGAGWTEFDPYNFIDRTSCMAEADNFNDSLAWDVWDLGIRQHIEGSGINLIYGIMVTPLYQESELAVWCGDGVVRLDEVGDSAQVTVYPNPVADILYFDKPVSSFVLFSVDGRPVKTEKNTSEVDLSGLQNGLYILNMILVKSSSQVSMKIVKQ